MDRQLGCDSTSYFQCVYLGEPAGNGSAALTQERGSGGEAEEVANGGEDYADSSRAKGDLRPPVIQITLALDAIIVDVDDHTLRPTTMPSQTDRQPSRLERMQATSLATRQARNGPPSADDTELGQRIGADSIRAISSDDNDASRETVADSEAQQMVEGIQEARGDAGGSRASAGLDGMGALPLFASAGGQRGPSDSQSHSNEWHSARVGGGWPTTPAEWARILSVPWGEPPSARPLEDGLPSAADNLDFAGETMGNGNASTISNGRWGEPVGSEDWGATASEWGPVRGGGWGEPSSGGWDEPPPDISSSTARWRGDVEEDEDPSTMQLVFNAADGTDSPSLANVVIRVTLPYPVSVESRHTSNILIPFPTSIHETRRWRFQLPMGIDGASLPSRIRRAMGALHAIFRYFATETDAQGAESLTREWSQVSAIALELTTDHELEYIDRVLRLTQRASEILPMSTWVGVFGQWRRSWYWKHGGLGVNTERRVLDVTWHYLSSGGYTPGYDRKMTGRTH
ncbi:hypothetical protein C8Q76DRAFT_697109 [Earliella scabrosa]|nr:hypothetical protein C8Q76DRAFT_697109 [Earliella scabrosa]